MSSPESINRFLDAVFMRVLTTNTPNPSPDPGSFPAPEALPQIENTIIDTLSTWASACGSPRDTRTIGTRIGTVLSAAAPRKGIELYELETMLRDVITQGSEKQKELENKHAGDMASISHYFALDDLLIFTEAAADSVKKADWRGRVEEWLVGVVEKS